MNRSDLEKWLGTPVADVNSAELSNDSAQGFASGQTTQADVSIRTLVRKLDVYVPIAERLGFDVQRYDGLPWFFVKPPELGFAAKTTGVAVLEEEGGFVLDLSDPATIVAIITEQNEGLAFSFDSGILRAALLLKVVELSVPEIDSPLEDLSLDLVEVDPWLSERSFELLNASNWGVVVGMGLIGRHKPMDAETSAAIMSAAAGAPLNLPESTERTWFSNLSHDTKQWVFQELRLRTQDLVGALEDVLDGEVDEQLMIDRDDIESVCWVAECDDELLKVADTLGESLISRLPVATNEQLFKAAIDYADQWWTQSVPLEDFDNLEDFELPEE